MCLCDTQIQPQLALLAHYGTTFWETMQGITSLGHPLHCLKKTEPLRLIWHNFMKFPTFTIIFRNDRPVFQFSIDYVKKFIKIGLEPAA